MDIDNKIIDKTCNLCGKKFNLLTDLQRHKNRKTPCVIIDVLPENINNPNKCNLCNKIFSTSGNLRKHSKICKVVIEPIIIENQHEQEIRILKEQNELLKNEIIKLQQIINLGDNRNGYLYFITELPFNSKVKIGISKNPEKRLKQLQTGNPNKLIIYHTIKSPDYKELEKTMHNICVDLKIINEWFDISELELNSLIAGL
ncbi:hypothetical protein PV-S19_0007 [Pacmanvirus S19]|nr:hypothetical protein PV-S19_0007 [Pacmanvirus S19]